MTPAPDRAIFRRRFRSRLRRPTLLLAPLFLAAAACERGTVQGAAVTARDSAGVRIVESSAPAWEPGQEWTIAQEPETVIGRLDGAEPYLLSSVRDALRLSDGRIVVANGGTNELRVFDPEGRFLGSLGGRGKGPGEFDNLGSLHLLPGDSLAAWDPLLRRLTVFRQDGRVAREWTVGSLAVFMPPILGVFEDGSLLSASSGPRSPGQPTDQVYRDSLVWVRVRPGSTEMDVIGGGPGAEQMLVTRGSSTQNYQVLFGRTSLTAGAPDRWFAADNGRYEIAVRSPTGQLIALIRRSVEPPPVTPEVLQAVREVESRRQERAEASMREIMAARGHTYEDRRLRGEEVPHHPTMPFFDRLLPNERGNLWVRDYRPTPDAPQRWSVFDRSGRWLGELQTPVGIEVYQIGDDFLLGRATDEMDVPFVHLYRLRKPVEDGADS
jgi:hypothetical protein